MKIGREEPTFSLNEFKRWLQANSGNTGIEIVDGGSFRIGEHVKVRLSKEKMAKRLIEANPEMRVDQASIIAEHLGEEGATLESISGAKAKIRVLGSGDKVNIQRLFLRKYEKPKG